jgi:hypothetical protein
MHARPTIHPITVQSSCARATGPKIKRITFRPSQNPASTRPFSHSPTYQRLKSERSPAPGVCTMPHARRAWGCASSASGAVSTIFLVRPSSRLGRISQTLYSRVLTGGYVAPQPGPILAIDTNIELGQHGGLWTYTIGQRSRLNGLTKKLLVAAKDHKKNAIYVALPEFVPLFVPPRFGALMLRVSQRHPALLTSSITSNDFSWIWSDEPPSAAFSREGFRASVQVRYRTSAVPVTVRQRWTSKAVHITFDEPYKAVAHGQIAVLYDGDHCLGCGSIDETTTLADSNKFT